MIFNLKTTPVVPFFATPKLSKTQRSLSNCPFFQIFNKPLKLEEVAKKMKKKYSQKKEAWNNKRSKWKLKLKRMKILISKAREKQSKFYQGSPLIQNSLNFLETYQNF